MLGAGLLRASRAASPAARGLPSTESGRGRFLPRVPGRRAWSRERSRRQRGLTPRPSPACAPFAPFRPGPAPASPTWPLVLPARLSAWRGRDPARGSNGARAGRLRGGSSRGSWGRRSSRSALLLLRPRRGGRWTLIPAGGESECLPSASWIDTLTSKPRALVP